MRAANTCSSPAVRREMCIRDSGCRPDVYCEEDLFNLARPYYEAAKKRVAEKNAASDGKIKYGIGVSLGVYGCGLDNSDASECWADLNPDGTVTLRNSCLLYTSHPRPAGKVRHPVPDKVYLSHLRSVRAILFE